MADLMHSPGCIGLTAHGDDLLGADREIYSGNTEVVLGVTQKLGLKVKPELSMWILRNGSSLKERH